MHKSKNQYIKYSKAELEDYCKHPETCIKKINCIEPIRFTPTIFATFQSSILKILGRSIGKYNVKLEGVVLDFRNTKILATQSDIRADSAYSVIKVETDFYIFQPRKGAIVTGVVKHINSMAMESVISVVIYRVFNVKVTIRGKVKNLERNQEIKIRVKDFHFENIIPFIEGEVVDTEIIVKSSQKKLFDEIVDSGISESSITSEIHKETPGSSKVRIKLERETSYDDLSLQNIYESSQSRKKIYEVTEEPLIKRVKLEPCDDEDDIFGGLKLDDIKSDPESSTQKSWTSKKPSKAVNSSRDTNGDDKTRKSKDKTLKKKKNKRSKQNDDFETSLQLLLNSAQDR